MEKEMGTHSSILTGKIPGTEEPGGLQPMRLQSQTQLSSHTHTIKNKWHQKHHRLNGHEFK